MHFYNSANWSDVTLYAYDGRTGTTKYLTGIWPGSAMTPEGNGWYTYPEILSDYAQVIFTNGDTEQIPGVGQSGYEVSGESWIKDGTVYFNSNIVVSHIDTNGNKLKDDEVITGTQKSINDKYTTTADETLGNVVATLGASTGYWNVNTVNIIYVYKSAETPTEPPTEQPTEQPSETPTEQPTDQPTDEITISYVLGDATSDNKIGLADALYLLKVVVGQIEVTDNIKKTIIDCDANGQITLADALMVMKYTINDPKCGNVGNTYTITVSQ